MSKLNKKGFTLIELLVVITILAIISVVAYTNFSGSTDKAKNSKKISDIASIETGLQTFYQEKNYFPFPAIKNDKTNVWGFSGTTTATPTNTFTGTKDSNNQILSVSGSLIVGGGLVYKSGATDKIGAKGTIDSSVLPKQYLSTELLDPSLKDIKVGDNETFGNYGIGKYVYSIYAKNNSTWDSTCQKGSAYNLALTIKNEQGIYETKVIGNFDKSTCANCPDSLIGSGTVSIIDKSSTGTVYPNNSNQLVPYPIDGF